MFGVVGDTDATHPKRRHGSKNKSWVTKSTSQGRRANNIDKVPVYQHTTTVVLLYIINRTLYFFFENKIKPEKPKKDRLIMGSSRIEYSEKYADDAYEYR